MDTMLAAVLYGVGDLRVEERPRPEPARGQVLVRVAACGVCGSDVPRIFEHGTYRFPLIPGHEFAGRVAACGEGVEGWAEGDPVTVFPLLPCRRCRYCERGVFELCDHYDYLGSRSDGAFAEYVVAPAWNLVRVPAAVPLDHAALTEPASVALHALRRFGVAAGDRVAILGAGPIGLLLAQWARALGAGRVFLFDLVAEKLAAARELGFADTINSSECDPVERALAETEGVGVDLVVEAAGVPATVVQAIQMARKLGKIVLMGNPAAGVTLSQEVLWSLLRKQLTIRGTWNSSFARLPRSEWATSLEAMARGGLRIEPLITHRFPLAQANEALELLRDRREFANKVLLTMSAQA